VDPIVHITPELAPVTGGIADYAAILGGALNERGIQQHYLIAGHGSDRSARAHSPDITVLNLRRAETLLCNLRDLKSHRVLLQYSGYGYEPRGAPVWLVRGLERWTALSASHRLVVMFHETWANGLPWQSSFWVSSLQRWCVTRIAALADAVVTNTSYYRSRLESLLRPRTPIHVQPTFSNVGELDPIVDCENREPICILFGSASTRYRTSHRFKRYQSELRRLGIERVIEIGNEPDVTASSVWHLPVTRLGHLKCSDISALMARAKYGICECPVHIAAKSGVFAALAAHGVVPIHPEGEGLFDGVQFGRDTVAISAFFRQSDRSAEHAPSGRVIQAWYQNHSVDRQVSDTWLRLLSEP
jgi:hypothetical protein